MRYTVCGKMHIKEPLLLIGESSPCGGSRFPRSLSEWSFTMCLTPYKRKYNVLSASLNNIFPSFQENGIWCQLLGRMVHSNRPCYHTRTDHVTIHEQTMLPYTNRPCHHTRKAVWRHCEATLPGRKEMFYLTTHSTHFIDGYMASCIW